MEWSKRLGKSDRSESHVTTAILPGHLVLPGEHSLLPHNCALWGSDDQLTRSFGNKMGKIKKTEQETNREDKKKKFICQTVAE